MIVEPKEWISKPDDDGNGLLKALIKDSEVEFPIPIETHNVFHEDVEINKDQDFELILECAGKPTVYKDEETYNKETNKSMHFESVIPVGLFSASRNESFVQTPHVILNGKVVKTYGNSTQFGFDESDVLYSLSCLGNEYDAVMHSEFSDNLRIEEGNIVSCVYRVQGWPNQNDYSDK